MTDHELHDLISIQCEEFFYDDYTDSIETLDFSPKGISNGSCMSAAAKAVPIMGQQRQYNKITKEVKLSAVSDSIRQASPKSWAQGTKK